MRNLYIMVGIPGSGKTTWCKNHLKNLPQNSYAYISRDEIRFSLLNPGEEYFSHEKAVFRIFVNKINEALRDGKDVYADATHLNYTSRAKLLNAVDHNYIHNIHAIWVKASLPEAIKQNENRKGTKAYVPEAALKQMAYNVMAPSFDENFKTIYLIEKGEITILSQGEGETTRHE